jgi:protein-disulfide isomerase
MMKMRSALLIIVPVLAGLAIVAVLITAQTPGREKALAEVGGEIITSQEVRDALGFELAQLEEQLYDLKRQKLDELIDEKVLQLEAARREVTTEELIEAEVNQKVEPISDEETEVLYQANKDRFNGEEEDLRRQIRTFLENRQRQARRRIFLELLRADADVAVYLEPPEPYRAEVAVDGAPFRGSETAPVTIVKFEDFHCPYCRRVQTTLAQLMLRYGEDLKVVHRDFPLDGIHPQARKAHEAARCAAEQDQFWAYHDILFANPPTADEEELTAFAEETGLDMEAFGTCMESDAYKDAIQRDVDAGFKLGLSGTPAFFINGRLLSGALPMQDFVEVIDQELKLAN